MPEQPRLSILIVGWNVADLLRVCLESVQRTAQGFSYEVIVVDNASTDGSSAMVEHEFPWVQLIRNRLNVGFPRANNQALAVAHGEFVLYLNPDTRVDPDTLATCMAELDADPAVGMVGCRLDLPDGRIQYESARRTYHLRHLLYESLYLHMFFPRSRIFGDYLYGWWDHRDRRDVEAIAGAFMMVRRHIAQEIGGLPDDLFMFHEDVSFCLRLLKRGWRIRYLGDVGTLHFSGQSSARSELRLDLLRAECRFMQIREADGGAAAFIGRVVWALASLIRLVISFGAPLVPGAARKYPKVFDTRAHWFQIIWCLAPAVLSHRLPRPPAAGVDPLTPTMGGVAG